MAELYDLKNDPGETRNLISTTKHNAKLRELQVQMAQLMEDAGLADDKMPLDEGVKKDLPDLKIR